MSTAHPIPVSAVVICLNEERNIARCIQSLRQITDDIVLVDSGSSDNTLAIAKREGARIFEKAWEGYSEQKNFGNQQAQHNYILSIDADECISETLAASILAEMQSPTYRAYEFDFITSWGNQWIKYGGWVPDRHCRLFDKRKISWGTKGVHEELLLNGLPMKRLKGPVFHYTATTRSYYRSKMTRYAETFAANKQQLNKRYPFWKKYLSTAFRFLRDYIFKCGFLDGRAGWEIAIEEARYTFLKYKWAQR